MPVEASVKTQGAENRSHPAVIRVYDEAGQRDWEARAQGRSKSGEALVPSILRTCACRSGSWLWI